MSDFNRGYPRNMTAGVADMSVDAGLRAFMLGVYNKVGLGLVLSAAMAYLTSSVPAVTAMLFRVTYDGRLVGYTGLGALVAFAPLMILLFSGFAMRSISPRASGAIYWVITALIGASLGSLAFLYTGASIATTFLVTATAFGALSLVGYTTKKDLTGFGSFLIMGLVGLIIAIFVSMFLHSAMMEFMISVFGVLIFAGLIAYDTQRLKATYYQLGGNEAAIGVATNFGALSLYLDFINLFRFLLYFMGGSRR
ncbi:Bax inhibitor-1/YccA family protein [Phenylobacterium montanum]|uniref:Bax inhibitor-1/YccA family protein n=1 Tax=Phenylobacterium montanum TaxID=2823693 RepID=A0A975IUM5_9CAUL|nr:Bax inhibitor-1/YccA family protein [Caulobacter sp. S6]QUD86401.1 Bax inhibitor-1/YccA family protein [Caulobacter sp. S6]